jgi:biuret amidohydrolase
MEMDQTMIIKAEPYPFECVPARCALLIIDMQRDFLNPAGSGKCLGMRSRNYAERSSRIVSCWQYGVPTAYRLSTPAKAIAPT